MIEIKDKEGNILLKTDKKPEDLLFSFTGKLQEITAFKLSDVNNPTVALYKTLFKILYEYWWGNE